MQIGSYMGMRERGGREELQGSMRTSLGGRYVYNLDCGDGHMYSSNGNALSIWIYFIKLYTSKAVKKQKEKEVKLLKTSDEERFLKAARERDNCFGKQFGSFFKS